MGSGGDEERPSLHQISMNHKKVSGVKKTQQVAKPNGLCFQGRRGLSESR